jgi:tRNA-specific 2-thiouridylase
MRLCGSEYVVEASSKKVGSDSDISDAKKVCDMLCVPHDVIDLSEKFKNDVVENFVKSYIDGKTPNPCIECNRCLKFDGLMNHSDYKDYAVFATGHYAIVERSPSGRFLLKKSYDLSKDQSYVLYSLTQDKLSRIKFPLGKLKKSEVREIAREIGLVNSEKTESQDICFIPDGDYASFIERYTGHTFPSGNFISPDGKVLGRHNGIIRYTIGQRKGLGIALGKPMFVCEKNIKNNTVTLAENDSLFGKTLTAHSINLIACDKIDTSMRVEAKIRYNQNARPATVIQTSKDTCYVEFDEPQRAIASGQSVVFYDGDVVIGGGIID